MTDYGQAGTGQRPPAHTTPGRSGGGPSPSAGPALPGRPDILATVTAILSRRARPWAWQGPADAAGRWLTETGPKDLDLWYDPGPPGAHDDPATLICEALP